MAKLIDIAKKANVSLATASLALNDNPLINKKTREKVKKCAKSLNYFPNLNAQRLARGRSYNISIMLNSDYFFTTSNTYYLKVIGGIIGESEETEYTINFSFYGSEKDVKFNEKKFLKNTDGIIIFDVIDKLTLDKIKKDFEVPIVLLDNHKKHRGLHGVDNDDFDGAYKATKYLIDQGHKNIGYLGIPDSHPLGKQCWKGFKKALEESNLEAKAVYKKCGFGIKSGKRAIEKILSKKEPSCTSFFCVDYYIAIGAIEELKIRGFKIPDDFSFVALGDMELSSEMDPPLTVIRIKMEELGKTSLKKIIKLINNDYKGELKTIIDNELIIRKSCKNLNNELE